MQQSADNGESVAHSAAGVHQVVSVDKELKSYESFVTGANPRSEKGQR